ncbi:MAG: RsmD family RNA methyltransferase [Alphaproteobacteria bacterium]
MRIVGGKHKGRRLSPPEGLDIRPTSDRAREALFNILSHGDYGGLPAGKMVLDSFAGTGALGFEALSWGAAGVCFIERNKLAVRRIRDMAEELGEQVQVLHRDATQPGVAPNTFDLVLLDAPYRTGQSEPSLLALAEGGWLANGCTCCVELARKEHFQAGASFTMLDERTYGAARMIILRWSA